jgi:hypothetical protein
VGRLIGLALRALLIQPGIAAAAAEESFDVLQIGTKTYKNVTVTTKAKNYIFILHSTGMTNVKVIELSPGLRKQLGYVEKPKVQGNGVASWAKRGLAKLQLPAIQQLERKLRGNAAAGRSMAASISPNTALWLLVIVFASYLLFCQCCNLICLKTGDLPGNLIWVPVLQLFPMLRAARMSPWWFLAYLIPVLNLVAAILWSVKIVEARAKSGWVALFLLLPVTTFLAFLYLAFSAPAPRKEEPVISIMTLDAA